MTRFCDLAVDLVSIREMARVALGDRGIPIIGGTVTWHAKGCILNPGADWYTISADTSADLDTRYAF
ncbi:MAG: DUF3237 family protein [Paracoccaceae bacterium]